MGYHSTHYIVVIAGKNVSLSKFLLKLSQQLYLDKDTEGVEDWLIAAMLPQDSWDETKNKLRVYVERNSDDFDAPPPDIMLPVTSFSFQSDWKAYDNTEINKIMASMAKIPVDKNFKIYGATMARVGDDFDDVERGTWVSGSIDTLVKKKLHCFQDVLEECIEIRREVTVDTFCGHHPIRQEPKFKNPGYFKIMNMSAPTYPEFLLKLQPYAVDTTFSGEKFFYIDHGGPRKPDIVMYRYTSYLRLGRHVVPGAAHTPEATPEDLAEENITLCEAIAIHYENGTAVTLPLLPETRRLVLQIISDELKTIEQAEPVIRLQEFLMKLQAEVL